MKEYIIGIDLGTTYSCLAYLDDDGEVRIHKNNLGEETTPSTILFDGNEVIVGSVAKNQATLFPECFVDMVKRDMGTDRERIINGKTYTPSVLSAYILKKLISEFGSQHECKIKRAVVTVPAYFGDAEKEATVYAGKIAGIDETILLAEPIAASIAYGITASEKKQNVLVYDLGGGTFDATVLEIDGSSIISKSVDGDKYLGGKDWDNRMIELIMEHVDSDSNNDVTMDDMENDPTVRMFLKIDSERYKKDLSNMPKIRGTLKCGSKNVAFEVTRDDFENATNDLIEKTMMISKSAIAASGLTDDQIDTIILVGGSSRMPQVSKAISATFPGKPFKIHDPDLSIAKGAALYSASERKSELIMDTGNEDDLPLVLESVRELDIRTVLSKTFGTNAGYEGRTVVSNVVFRNSPLPARDTRSFSVPIDGPGKLIERVYENEAHEGTEILELDDAVEIGTYEVVIPNSARRGDEIIYTIDVQKDGRLTAITELNSVETKHVIQLKGIHMDEDDIIDERKNMCNLIID